MGCDAGLSINIRDECLTLLTVLVMQVIEYKRKIREREENEWSVSSLILFDLVENEKREDYFCAK